MKELVISALFLFLTSSLQAQENFKWDKIISIEGNQYDLFLKAKKYISDNKGFQFADEENKTVSANLNTMARYQATSVVFNNLIFEYRLQILAKDNKIRVLIDNVICTEKKYHGLVASINYPGEQYGIPADKFYSVMRRLRDSFNSLILEIEIEMNKPLPLVENEW